MGKKDEVSERLALLERYQRLAPSYLEARRTEEAAMEERVALENELRDIVVEIGRDPAGILPKRRRTKAEQEAAESGKTNGSGKKAAPAPVPTPEAA